LLAPAATKEENTLSPARYCNATAMSERRDFFHERFLFAILMLLVSLAVWRWLSHLMHRG
jgi:hypothetical protein